MKLPDGATTISGQLSHSLKLSFGFNARSCVDDSWAVHRDASDTVTVPLPQPILPSILGLVGRLWLGDALA